MDSYQQGFNNFRDMIGNSIKLRQYEQERASADATRALQNQLLQQQIAEHQQKIKMAQQQEMQQRALGQGLVNIPTTKPGQVNDPQAFEQAMQQWRQTSTPTPLMRPQFGAEGNLMAEVGAPVQPNYQMLPDQSGYQKEVQLPRSAQEMQDERTNMILQAISSGTKVSPEIDNVLKMLQPQFQPRSVMVDGQRMNEMALGKFEYPQKQGKIIDKTIPLGNKTRVQYTDGTYEDLDVSVSPNTVFKIENKGTGEGNLAQSNFVTPDGEPLVYDKKTGSYRPAVVEGGGSAVPKPAALSPEAATRIQQFDTVINNMPRLRALVFDKDGNINKYDIANAAVGMPFTKGREMKQTVKRTIEQVLRIATGAAAPDSEVSSYMDMYSPQVGDTKDMIKAKFDALEASARGARELATQGRTVQKYDMSLPTAGSSAASKGESRISADGKFRLTKDANGNITKTRIK